jgi:TonB-dependent receptor
VGDDQRLGFLLGGSYDRNNRAINDVEVGWSVDDNGRSYPVEWDQRDYAYGRVRYGLGGDLDYRFNDQSQMWLKGLWSKFYNYGLRYRFDVASGDDSTQAATPTGGIGTGATFTRESSNRTPQEQMWGFTGGGKTLLGSLLTDYSLNYSGTEQSITDYRTSPFSYDGIGGNGANVRYDASDPNNPRFSFVNAGDAAAAANPANYQLSKYSLSDGLTKGHDIGGALNLVWHVNGSDDSSSAIKFGAKLRDEGKDFTSRSASFTPTSSLLMSSVVAAFTDPNFYNALSSGFTLGPVPDNAAVKAWENANFSSFTNSTNAARDSTESFSGSERVMAAYGMGTTDFGALRMNVGLRLEQTHTTYTGHVATTPADANGNKTGPAVITTVPGSQDYLDLFPSVQLRYATSPSSDFRFAVTRAIARPNYSDIAPHLTGEECASCARKFNNLSSGNPNLKPQHAWNFDALYEDYLPSSGIISGGVFYKRISDFIYDREFVYNGPVTEFDGYYGVEPANGGSGTILGFEGDYAQKLTILPGALSGLGFDINFTHADSKAQILADTASTAATLGNPTTRNAPLPRQAKNVGNFALTYDTRRLSVRAAWQYQGASITSYGDGTRTANGDDYFYPHSQIDASAIVNLTPGVQLQIQGLNLNNAVFGFFNGAPGSEFSVQREYYGRAVIVGVKYGF